jgi:hypothetical protein
MTNKSIDVTRLVAELRKRFGSAKNLCRVLGIDENLLKSGLALDSKGNRLARDQVENLNGSAPAETGAAALRLAIENEFAGFENLPAGLAAKIFKLLEQHAPLNGDEEPLGEREMQELRRREEHGPEALDAGELARILREYGVNADEESVKRALDDMPMNALGGSLGGKFAEKRAGGGAMDSASRKFGLGRIEAWGAADHAVDRRPAPSAARLERIDRKFGTERIGVHGASGSTW